MSRRVISSQMQAGGTAEVDTYFDRIVKLIPSDIVAAWIFVASLITNAQDVPTATVLWVAFIFGLVLTAVWTYVQTKRAVRQTLVSTIAFAVWVFAIGGPFVTLDWYRSLYGTLALVAYTLVIAPIIPLDS
jgi:hypothetical protein